MPDPASNQEKAWQKAHRLGEGVQGALTDPRPRGKLDPQDQDVEGNGWRVPNTLKKYDLANGIVCEPVNQRVLLEAAAA